MINVVYTLYNLKEDTMIEKTLGLTVLASMLALARLHTRTI